MEAYASWIQETTSTKPTLTLKTTIHTTTHPQPNKCNSPWSPYSYTIRTFPTYNRHWHHGISTVSQEHPHISLLWVIIHKPNFPFRPIVLGVTVQLAISHSTSPTSSSHTIFHHTLRTQNLFPTLLSNLYPSRLMQSCLQLMSPPYTQTLHMMAA